MDSINGGIIGIENRTSPLGQEINSYRNTGESISAPGPTRTKSPQRQFTDEQPLLLAEELIQTYEHGASPTE